ncbi:MAG: hypothetical protein ABIH26_04030 [Candidatus Eisenbacteria bacterium]
MLFFAAAALLLLGLAAPSRGEVNSLFLGGLGFFDTGELDRTAADTRTGTLSPGFDGDFLLTFRDKRKTSVLAGFGIFWSRRTEKADDIPFAEPEQRSRFEVLGFPFSAGFVRRDPERSGRGWMWGALAHYYFLKATVDADPNRGDPAWFVLDAGHGERDAQGPAFSAFAVYELPFFMGRAGAGVKARWAFLSASEEAGVGTPDFNLSGVTLFLSAALR